MLTKVAATGYTIYGERIPRLRSGGYVGMLPWRHL
nr:MAG TPA: hypothetical protein [Caudoviricetes sp.]